ncbi:MAG: helix-turn-helix transcriptional regulator [Pseudomonadota bacterium]|nr:helix-turn-helix transcriptional regulator [Pseudomonadota bacterium]
MDKTIDFSDPRKAEAQVHQHIGCQLRHQRLIAGLSQEDMAQELHITFQQYQKYEKATNRVSPGKLYLLARALQVSVGSLFPQPNVRDYDPAPPRVLQIMRRISRVVALHPDEMSAISKALILICGKDAADEQ